MKLDVNVLRYLGREEFRVLTAVEMGQKNHEIVPLPLVDSIAGLKHGGTFRALKNLLRHKLVHHDGSKYDGYRLTYMGYDFLAIRTLVARGLISGIGRQIGVGKESDIFEARSRARCHACAAAPRSQPPPARRPSPPAARRRRTAGVRAALGPHRLFPARLHTHTHLTAHRR